MKAMIRFFVCQYLCFTLFPITLRCLTNLKLVFLVFYFASLIRFKRYEYPSAGFLASHKTQLLHYRIIALYCFIVLNTILHWKYTYFSTNTCFSLSKKMKNWRNICNTRNVRKHDFPWGFNEHFSLVGGWLGQNMTDTMPMNFNHRWLTLHCAWG